MKIIITGATGSLGAYLTRHFSSLGHEIIATGKIADPPKQLYSFAKYIQADVTRPHELPSADICIHTAALADDHASDNELYTPNVTGTANVAKATTSCQQFIYISSSAVYLPSHQLITEEMTEKSDSAALSPYGRSKLLAEEMLRQTTNHPTCFVLRARALYGVGDKVIFPRMLKLVKNGKLQSLGDMKISIAMTHYSNLAHAIECCIQSDKKGYQVYNITDDHVYMLIDAMRKITTEIYGRPLAEKQIPIWLLRLMASLKVGNMSPLLVRSLTQDMVLDISKIKSELGYAPKVNLYEILPEIGNWIRQIGGPEVLKNADKKLAWEVQ